MPPPLLSLCIPTFNRAHFLDACLDSLRSTSSEVWEKVDLVISDNASTDHTEEVVRKYQQQYSLHYYRNESNIGAERNFFAAAKRSAAEYVWIFGDDDILDEGALAKVLTHLQSGCDMVVVNYSSWSKEMDRLLKPRGLQWVGDKVYTSRDAVLLALGPHIGYISSVIVRRDILLSAAAEECERYMRCCFPHMYSIYRGLPSTCRAIYLESPVFRRRECNNDWAAGDDAQSIWLKCFIEGTAVIFEALENCGYSRKVIQQAKDHTLKSFGIGNVLAGIHNVDRAALRRFMYTHYRHSEKFWKQWLPMLLLPASVSEWIYSVYRRRLRRHVSVVEQGAAL
jgi:glycosyltransferase involved in cell wall biosynthesis